MPPVGAAIAAIGTAIGGAISAVSAFAASSFIGSLLVNTAISVGISLIARALTPKPTIKQSGIQTAVTTTGGTEPQAFIVGRTATAGHHVCPPMSHDDSGTPNGFLTYVVELSDMPGIALSRVILNDGYSDLGPTAHADYGFPLLKQRVGGKDHAWIKFYDGRQTTADPMLVAKYASYPERRRYWSDDDKLRIVEESFIGHRQAAATARRHGICRSLLTTWRRQYRNGELGSCRPGSFAPVTVTNAPAPQTNSIDPCPPPVCQVEIALPNGCRVIVPAGVDSEALARILAVVDGQ